jgi:Phage Mu protein F like protein
VVAEFGEAVAESAGRTYNLANPRAETFLKRYMSERVDLINATTRKALQKALASEDPETAVREVFRHAREARAKAIAISETVRAGNWAAIDAGKWDSELDLKTWISQRDRDVRPTHVQLDGQTVGWLEDFVSPSGAHGPSPGQLGDPAEDVNCRCFSAPTRPGARRALTEGRSLQEFADDLRRPHEAALEAAWRRVFDEQEASVLAGLE